MDARLAKSHPAGPAADRHIWLSSVHAMGFVLCWATGLKKRPPGATVGHGMGARRRGHFVAPKAVNKILVLIVLAVILLTGTLPKCDPHLAVPVWQGVLFAGAPWKLLQHLPHCCPGKLCPRSNKEP